MSDLFVDNIKHQSSQGSGTITLGASGEKINLGADAGGTLSNRPAFEANLSSDQTVTGGTETLIAFNTESFDTDNAYDNSTNYRFTPLVAGKYYTYAAAQQFTSGNTLSYIEIRKNSTKIARFAVDHRSSGLGTSNSHFVSAVVDLNGSSDYLSVYASFNGTGTPVKIAAYTSSNPVTYFGAYKLIGA